MFSPQRNAWSRPRGARHLMYFRFECETMFQSTRPRGARPRRPLKHRSRSGGFNPRARVGRDTLSMRFTFTSACFNLRARVGRDRAPDICIPGMAVSIHAPAWGATSFSCAAKMRLVGFNPRARVGRDARGSAPLCPAMCFNPRARVGRDKARVRHIQTQPVSIHAPAWGATVHLLFPIILHKYASLFEDVSHVCPHFRFMSVME